MTDSMRRQLLKTGGEIIGTLGLAGCLRLNRDTNQTATAEPQSTGTSDGSQSDSTETTDSSQSNAETLSVERFYMDNFDSDGSLYDDAKLDVEADSDRSSVDGAWSGDREVFATQACGRYSYDLLEDGSVIASSGDKILIVGYQYALIQSADAAFITCQPSVQDDWDYTLRLSYPNGEYNITPEVRPDDGVFEFAFSAADIDSGRYEWTLEITPPDSFTIEIGTFNDQLISVSPDSGSTYPSRAEAIQTSGSAANDTAVPVDSPQIHQRDGLEIHESGHGGGGPGDITGQYITRDVRVDCRSDCLFGPGTDRQFRINNLTTQTSLTFTPE